MTLIIEPRAFDHPDAQVLVGQIQQLYGRLYGGHDDDLTEPAQFAPPHGRFLVGYLDAEPVASGGWRLVAPGTAEIKRMYVMEPVRGRGLARQMLAALETSAAAVGATRMVLNTGYRQPEAMALYESSGYCRSDQRFGHYADIEGVYFFSKVLTRQQPAS